METNYMRSVLRSPIKHFGILLFLALPLAAQEDRPVRYHNTDPTGACSVITPVWNNWLLGKVFQCVGASKTVNVGSWVQLGAGTGVTSFKARTGVVVPATGDYTAAQVTNAVDQTGSYANPAWITSLAWVKITGINLSQNADTSVNASATLTEPSPSGPTFNAGGTTTCNLALSAVCGFTMTGPSTLAFSNPHGSGPYILKVTMDGTGGRALTYPGTVINCPTPSPTASVTSLIGPIVYDGSTNYYCPGTTDTATLISGSTRAAPGNASASELNAWFDNTDNILKSKDSSGTVASLAKALTCGASNHLSAFATTGGFTCSADTGSGTTHETVPLRMSPCGGTTNAVIAAGGVGGCQGTGSYAELIFAGSVRLSFTVPQHWTGGTPTFYTRITEAFGNAGTVTLTAALASLANGSDLSAPVYNASSSVVVTANANTQVVVDGVIGPLAVSGSSTLVAGQLAEIKVTGAAGTFPNSYVRLYDSILDFPVN